MRSPSFLPLTLSTLTVVACGAEPVLSRTDLSLAFGRADLEVHGVSVEPETGRRFVLDAGRGIFELVDGRAELHADIRELSAEGHEPLSPFTDFAAMGQDQFALIAIGDGFSFDRVTGVFQRHFCYEPSDILPEPEPLAQRQDPIDPGEAYYQIAHNLSYDAKNARLVAQPQTFAEQDGALLSAHIGTFARGDGTEQSWFELPTSSVDAGGLTMDPEGRVLLGWDRSLWRYTLDDRSFEKVADLESIVSEVHGLAFDETTETALIVDNSTRELVEIDLGALAL